MSLTSKLKLIILPQSFPVGKEVLVHEEAFNVVRVVDFCMLHFPKNGNVTLEINYKSFSDTKKLNQIFIDAGFVSLLQFIQMHHKHFFVDTDRILGRFKAVIIEENYSIFGE